VADTADAPERRDVEVEYVARLRAILGSLGRLLPAKERLRTFRHGFMLCLDTASERQEE